MPELMGEQVLDGHGVVDEGQVGAEHRARVVVSRARTPCSTSDMTTSA